MFLPFCHCRKCADCYSATNSAAELSLPNPHSAFYSASRVRLGQPPPHASGRAGLSLESEPATPPPLPSRAASLSEHGPRRLTHVWPPLLTSLLCGRVSALFTFTGGAARRLARPLSPPLSPSLPRVRACSAAAGAGGRLLERARLRRAQLRAVPLGREHVRRFTPHPPPAHPEVNPVAPRVGSAAQRWFHPPSLRTSPRVCQPPAAATAWSASSPTRSHRVGGRAGGVSATQTATAAAMTLARYMFSCIK